MKVCRCGRAYSRQAWRALPLVGYQCVPEDDDGPEAHLEYRNCVCLSTLTFYVNANHRGVCTLRMASDDDDD